MKGNAGKLTEKEWDFRQLIHKRPKPEQRNELHAAIYYEYARESDSIRKLAAEYAALPEKMRRYVEEEGCLRVPQPIPTDQEIARMGFVSAKGRLAWPKFPELPDISPKLARMDFLPFKNCILWPTFFPETPWLDIPAGERTQRVRRYFERQAKDSKRSLLTINEGNESASPNSPTPKRGGRYFDGTVERLDVAVDWAGGNNSDIIAAFTDWVRKSRPRWIPETRGDASRANVDAAFLTRLAVMRLMHWYSPTEALQLAKDHDLPMPVQQSKALTMRHEVKADQRRLFQSENFPKFLGGPLIPAKEFPISWGTNSPRRHVTARRIPRSLRDAIGG